MFVVVGDGTDPTVAQQEKFFSSVGVETIELSSSQRGLNGLRLVYP